MTRTCPECKRVFDLLNEADAEEWHYGHDCEPEEELAWYDPQGEIRAAAQEAWHTNDYPRARIADA